MRTVLWILYLYNCFIAGYSLGEGSYAFAVVHALLAYLIFRVVKEGNECKSQSDKTT